MGLTVSSTVEPMLKDHIGNKKWSQDKWSLVMGCNDMQDQKYLLLQGRWSLMPVVSQDRFDCTSMFFVYISELPEGAIPIFLASKTQEIFECRADEDVTKERPYKLITKEVILQDLFNRAAVSDFSPYKQIIQVFSIKGFR